VPVPDPELSAPRGCTTVVARCLGPRRLIGPLASGALLALGGVTLACQAGRDGAATVPAERKRETIQASTAPVDRLRLLVADAPRPFLLDVESGTVRPLVGLPARRERGVGVAPVGDDALVVSYPVCRRCPATASVYVARRGSTAAMPLGTALAAIPSRDGRGVWLLRRDGNGCTIAREGLDGRLAGTARRVDCGTGLVAELAAGLLVTLTGGAGGDLHAELLRPDGSKERWPGPQPQPVAGNLVLSGANRRTPLLLHNMDTGATHPLAWPARHGYSLDRVIASEHGGPTVVRFARYSPRHLLDLWLFEPATRSWEHVPGTPVRLVPKATDVAWTKDGRLVVLSGARLGVWEDGERLTFRAVPPARQPGGGFALQ
jgi:hypothetical protein